MQKNTSKYIISIGLLALALACPSAVRAAPDVLPGWVLFETVPTSYFDGVYWQGVGLGNFTFGSHGSASVGDIDTIIKIPNTVSHAGPIQVSGVQLRTVDQVNLGGGPLGYYYVTLNTLQPSSGTLTLDTFPSGGTGGTFDTTFQVYFDIRYGSLTGPIVAPDQTLNLSITGAPWSRNAPTTGTVLLPGINYLLNGTDTSEDFWPGVVPDGLGGYRATPLSFTDSGKAHIVIVPEPATGLLVLLGFVVLRLRCYRNQAS